MDRPKPKLKSQVKDVPHQPADDDREPTKEEIMDDIRQGLRDVLAGEEGMPARESLEEFRRKIYRDADKG